MNVDNFLFYKKYLYNLGILIESYNYPKTNNTLWISVSPEMPFVGLC